MKKIFITLSLIFLLSSCSIDWNGEKDKKITELEKQVSELKKEKENDLFEKKQECIKYKNDMFLFAKNYNIGTYELSEILYSPTSKSCFFIAKINEPFGQKILFDYLNQTYIADNGITDCKNVSISTCELIQENLRIDFENKIKELKGE